MGNMQWKKVTVSTPSGKMDGIAPIVLSASRSTDIPAFYSEWFMRRLQAGYSVWTNPFNRKKRQYISYEKARVVVFWSKNPAPMLSRLDALDERGINYYFTFTLNDYAAEQLEPGVPSVSRRIETFKKLSERLGKERVIWRFDPILVGSTLTPKELLRRLADIGESIHQHTEKLVISFADIAAYRKVGNNLRSGGHEDLKEPSQEAILQIAGGIQELNRNWGLKIASCAEEVDLSVFGISHNRCIDDDLMARVFPDDAQLMDFLGRGAGASKSLFAASPADPHPLKDKGQREVCGCIVSKDIGRYNTCPHFCIYCYANVSQSLVRAMRERHAADAEEL